MLGTSKLTIRIPWYYRLNTIVLPWWKCVEFNFEDLYLWIYVNLSSFYLQEKRKKKLFPLCYPDWRNHKETTSVCGRLPGLFVRFFFQTVSLPSKQLHWVGRGFFVPPPSPESPTVPELFKDFVKQKFMLRWFEDYKRDGWIFVLVETLQEQQPSEQEEGGTGLQVWLVSSEREQRSGVTLKKFFFF